MKRFLFPLLILLIASAAFAQGHNNTIKTGNGRSGYRPGFPSTETDLSILTNGPRWTDTTGTRSSYISGWMKFNGGQTMSIGHHNFVNLVNSNVDSFRLEWRGSAPVTIGAATISYVISSYDNVVGGGFYIVAYSPPGVFSIHIPGLTLVEKIIATFTLGDTTINKYGVLYDKATATMRTYRNDSLQNTYTLTTYTGKFVTGNNTCVCIGNRTEFISASFYSQTYASTVNTQMFSGKISEFTFAKNDTALYWNLAQGNTQAIVPVRYIHGVNAFPDYILSRVGRYRSDDTTSLSELVMRNGCAYIDTMDAALYVTGRKANYRDCFPFMGSLAQFSSSGGSTCMGEGFAGEICIQNDTPYIAANDNWGNALTAFVTDYDSLKGVGKWNGADWLQLGYGFVTTTGTSGTLNIKPSGSSLVAVGYDKTAVGVGTINCIAKRTAFNWIPLDTGLTNGLNQAAGFISATVSNIIYVGGTFTFAGNLPAPYFAKWNGAWDTCGAGLDGTVLCIQPKVLSSGENGLILGGYFTQAFSKGVTLNCIGMCFWSIDSSKYKLYNNFQCSSGDALYDVYIDAASGWEYYASDGTITDGVVTTTSHGLCRYKASIGLQNIGLGVLAVLGSEAVTSVTIQNDTLYYGGSFTYINGGFYSRNIGAINIANASVIDMGYGCLMRMEDIENWTDNLGLSGPAGTKYVIPAGDFMDMNQNIRLNVSLYNPALNVP